MFGAVKLGEADYTVIWETLVFMSNILEKAFWSLQPFQGVLLLENAKNIHHKCFLRIWWNLELMLINMFNPTFAPNMVT